MHTHTHSLFNWSVPFLTWTAIAVLGCASVLLYFIPIRYIILVWGKSLIIISYRLDVIVLYVCVSESVLVCVCE